VSSRRLRARVVAGVLLATAVGVVAWHFLRPAGGPPVLGRMNVVLVTVDTLRADRVSPALTPVIDSLAARGIRFTGARSNVPLTLPAHATIFTGLLPPHHGVRLNGEHRLKDGTPTLARLLQSSGYRTGAFVGAYVLDSRFGLDQGFETYDDEIPKGEEATGSLEAERRGDVVAARAIAWLRALPGDERPFFLWMHLYDPHAPYEPPPSYLARAGGRGYDGEVAFADAQVGALMDALAASGRGGKTLMIVAGDHGESLGEHGEATHGMLLYEPAVRVPMILSGAGLRAGTRAEPASLVDLLPTVLRRLGLATPAGLDGRDLLAEDAAKRPAEVYAETTYPEAAGCSPLRSLFDGRWKAIVGPPAAELYDVARDPGEAVDEATRHDTIVAAMAKRADALAAHAAASGAAAPSAEVAERLRTLGYVAAAPAPRETGAAAPSPVTMVRAWGRFEDALRMLNAGRAAEAAAAMAALVKEQPAARVFQATYARALADAGRPAEAIVAYRAALRAWPQDTLLLHGLAVAARKAGLAQEAMKAEEAALAVDPTDAGAHNGRGLLLARAGRPAEARVAFERAVELDPSAVPFWLNLGNARVALGDAAAAESAYREALRLDGRSVDAANGLALVLIGTGRAAEAIPLLERVVAVAPDFLGAWLHLGMAKQAMGDTAGAAAAYRRVVVTGGPALRAAAGQMLAAIGGGPAPRR